MVERRIGHAAVTCRSVKLPSIKKRARSIGCGHSPAQTVVVCRAATAVSMSARTVQQSRTARRRIVLIARLYAFDDVIQVALVSEQVLLQFV